MNPFIDIVDRHLASPLAAARKARQDGRRVIGYVGDDIPVELILAANASPVRLRGVANQTTTHADRYLESSFPPALRSIAEQWLTGAFDFLEAVVFPRSDDGAQRLYYYLSELQRRGICGGPTPLIYDLARIRRDTSLDHTLLATRSLSAQLGTTEERLNAAGSRVHEREALLARLRTHAPTIAGSLVHRIWLASRFDWSEEFDASLSKWLSAPCIFSGSPQLLLAGSTAPDERFHQAVESAGGNIVAELLDGALPPSSQPKSEGDTTLQSIAKTYHCSAGVALTLMRTPDALVAHARAATATGVVLWLIEQDEGLVWEVPRQVAALKAAGIPVLVLTRQRWAADADTLSQVATFTRSLQEAP
jgi:hypothetical protein